MSASTPTSGIHGLMAEFERQLTVERTKAGIAAAVARGSKFGAKPKFTPEIKEEAFRLLTDEGWSAPEVAKHFNRRELRRVAGVAKLNEIDSLDHPPFLHVQAGNDALC